MKPRVVLCGSYHRDPATLRRLFRELEATGCRVLSPISTNFASLHTGVVTTSSEQDLSANEIERFHLRALREADFIMLHAPEGYVGTSCAYELGYASALHKPVYCFAELQDEMLATRVNRAASVFEIIEKLVPATF